ncbi:MAG TPA: Do family serine endopeptidase [Thermoguttaceae bacterium]|nr:Do family serine endopeptidase [Thermoguttaceae bacterium]
MNRSIFGVRLRTWLAGLGVLALVAGLAFSAGAVRHQATASQHNQVPWYADNTAPSGVDHAAIPAALPAGEKADPAADFANGLSRAFRQAAEKVLPSVVMITNTPAVEQASANQPNPPEKWWNEEPFGDMFPGSPGPDLRRFFREMPSVPQMPRHGVGGMGSGVIVDPAGVILTNSHVVDGNGQITVRLHDGREFEAVEVKQDPKTDVAILRIEGADNLQAARVGNSDSTQVGDWVLALGQPFGLEGTVTAGIVSAKGRGIGITARENFIQTDAAINPGNSGGPLVSLSGEVVGINTAISSRSGGNQGVGFAIPINLAKWVGGQLVENGVVHRAFLGVIIQPVTQPLAEQFGVKVHEGVLVTQVQPETPAAKSGMQEGDVIVEFAGKAVSNPQELQGVVERAPIGQKQPVVVIRDGKRTSLRVTVLEQPEDYGLARSESRRSIKPESSSFDSLGLQVESLTADVAAQLGLKADKGVVITDVRSASAADRAGLEAGMVITQANHKDINSVDDFRKAVDGQPLEKGALLLVRTDQGARFVVLKATG